MKKISQIQRIINFLKANPNQKFSAREVALKITEDYAELYTEKKAKFSDEAQFIQQIVAEIGSQKKGLEKANIQMQDKPRPRQYWFENNAPTEIEPILKNTTLDEKALYPLLMAYLQEELNLYCLRIDEKKSKNSKGTNGNKWLHPDIVAMQAVDENWQKHVKLCAQESTSQSVKLWSFEVKKDISRSNVREYFFQAVSNSSWANEGYLVATGINNNALDELRILSALHGIGVIVLDTEEPSQSEILLPAKNKSEVDWQSANRIVEENKDFETYIKYVSHYFQTGDITKENWQK